MGFLDGWFLLIGNVVALLIYQCYVLIDLLVGGPDDDGSRNKPVPLAEGDEL